MKTQPKPLKEGAYYRLSNRRVLKITHDTGAPKTLGGTTYGGKVYCEDLQGKSLEVRRKVFAKAKRYAYHPTIPEIWTLALKIQLDEDTKKKCQDPKHETMFLWMDRIEFFFKKLIEFDYLRIRTLGYYRHDRDRRRIAIKEELGRDLAYKLAETLYRGFASPDSDRLKEWGKAFRTWASKNDTEARGRLFKISAYKDSHLSLRLERECPVTGQSFEWICDGKTIKPHRRHLCRKESQEKTRILKEKYESLKAKGNRTAKEESQLAELTQIFETEFGWMGAYHLTDLEKVKPFSKAYADPETGSFPKAVVEIDIPTGKLVFANSLFKYLKDFPKDEEHARENSVNHTAGRNNNIFFHAKENQAFYVPLSNNMPHVWQNRRDPDKLRIGRAADEPRQNQWAYKDAIKGWIDRGSICTDLWAFHAVDRSRLPEKIEVDHFIVKVTPGRYRLTNHFEHKCSENGVFCEIEKVPNP